MQVAFRCPRCEAPVRCQVGAAADALRCGSCDWSKPLTASIVGDEPPRTCLVCGCDDLWRQKNFPQAVGLLLVAAGAIISTVFWARHRPAWAIGTLMAFALIDLLLYNFMKDMLVCYRCGGQHKATVIDEAHPKFDHELNERYRQEAHRLQQASQSDPSTG